MPIVRTLPNFSDGMDLKKTLRQSLPTEAKGQTLSRAEIFACLLVASF